MTAMRCGAVLSWRLPERPSTLDRRYFLANRDRGR